MKSFTLIISLLFLSLLGHSQLLINTSFGGNGDQYGQKIVQTADQGFLMYGMHRDTMANSDNDLMLVKTDSLGNQIWQKIIDNGLWETPYDLIKCSDGNYLYLAKLKPDTITLHKMDMYGMMLWEKDITDTLWRQYIRIVETHDKGFVLVFNDLKSNLIVKLDSFGVEKWRKTSVHLDENLIALARFKVKGFIISGTKDSSSVSGIQYSKSFVQAFDSTGNSIFKTFIDTNFNLYNSDLEVLDNNDVIVIQKSTNYQAKIAWLIVKLDSTGTVKWKKSFAGNLSHKYSPALVEVNRHNEIVIIQEIYDSWDKTNIYKLDSLGNPIYDYQILYYGNYSLADFIITKKGDYACTGVTHGFMGSLDFLLDVYGDSLFANTISSSNEIMTKTKVFPNPFSEFTHIEFEGVPLNNLQFEVYSLDGKLLRCVSNNKNKRLKFEKENLASGMYIYLVMDNHIMIDSGKLIVQ